MGAGHEHGDVKALPESRLLIAFALTGSFMVIEFIGGYLTESLALISDAMHMMT
ncbi:cation transporter, partial [Escherichia coli]